MTIKKSAMWIFLFTCICAMLSCSKNEEIYDSPLEQTKEKPTIEILASATSTMDLNVAFKVKGDVNTAVTLHYGYSSTKLSQSKKCTFDKKAGDYVYYRVLVSGFDRGDRIYFKGVAKNSVGECETEIKSRRIQ